jgi:steroid 5-alpha reductase family enzyme
VPLTLTGSVSYAMIVACAWSLGEPPDPRSWLLGGLVGFWALRLGSFLFLRIRSEGSDRRFDEIKPRFFRFLLAWTLQGLWVYLTLSCALAAMTSDTRVPVGWLTAVGVAVWCAGFAIEVAAHHQKRSFRARPENRDRFIHSGLWAWSRHPNYFGEITLWIGIALIALPALSGWQFATLLSPVFVFVLITRISGIPPLESRADEKWGGDPEYRAYKAKTPALLLRPPA